MQCIVDGKKLTEGRLMFDCSMYYMSLLLSSSYALCLWNKILDVYLDQFTLVLGNVVKGLILCFRFYMIEILVKGSLTNGMQDWSTIFFGNQMDPESVYVVMVMRVEAWSPKVVADVLASEIKAYC